MPNLGGFSKILQICAFSLFAIFLLHTPTHAQEVPELTGTSTEPLIGPGVNIESMPTPENVENPPGTMERSRYGSYERALVKAVDQINSQTANGANLKYNYTITILSGDFKDQTYTFRSSPADKIIPETGELVMIFLQPGGGNQPQIFLETYDRKNIYIFSLIILASVLLIFFGLRGLLIGLCAATILWLGIYISLPLYLRGWSLIIIFALTSLPLSLISSICQFGWHKKIIPTVLSVFIGTLIITVIAQIMAEFMHLSISLNAVAQDFFQDNLTLDSSKLLLIGLILTCFAIIQDTVSSISCGLSELKSIKPNATWRDLFTSGMNIGRSHSATMLTVLLLSWVGSSITIFIYRYQINDSWFHFFNQNPVSAAFLLAIAGSIGIILSVPIASAICSTALTRVIPPNNNQPEHDTPSWSAIADSRETAGIQDTKDYP